MNHHRDDQRASDPAMRAPPAMRRRSRQVSADHHRLNEHETQCDNPCESGRYVDRIAPRDAAGSPLQRRSARKQRTQGRPRSGSPGPLSWPLFPTRSDRLKDEVRLEAGVFCAPHQRTQKDGLEFTTVIGEVTMRLAKDGNDLRHLKTELPVRVSERGPMTLRVSLLPFGRVRPNLDALPGKRSPVACAAHGAASSRSHRRRSDPRSARPCGSCWPRPASNGSVRGLARGRATGAPKPRSLPRSRQQREAYGG